MNIAPILHGSICGAKQPSAAAVFTAQILSQSRGTGITLHLNSSSKMTLSLTWLRGGAPWPCVRLWPCIPHTAISSVSINIKEELHLIYLVCQLISSRIVHRGLYCRTNHASFKVSPVISESLSYLLGETPWKHAREWSISALRQHPTSTVDNIVHGMSIKLAWP